MTESTLAAGVVGVGAMGRHHARVYDELHGVDLVGVTDTDREQALEVAAAYDTEVRSRTQLFEAVDLVSVAVPTRYHYEVSREAIAAGVHVLVEKPFVSDIEQGRELVALAREHGMLIQVGHVERFNPAVRAVSDIVTDLDIIAVDVRRLGPPVDRDTKDDVILDLMIHDIDILGHLVASDIESISAASARNHDHVTAQLRFADGIVGNLTASRVTQEKVRDLAITAEDCRVSVDYERQSVEIHRHSLPEYYDSDGDLRYRHESIVERPTVENGEPLKAELSAFVNAVRAGEQPPISGEDALNVLEVAQRVSERATPQQDRSRGRHAHEQ